MMGNVGQIKEEIHKYLWNIGFTGWLDIKRDEVEKGICEIIDKYSGEQDETDN